MFIQLCLMTVLLLLCVAFIITHNAQHGVGHPAPLQISGFIFQALCAETEMLRQQMREMPASLSDHICMDWTRRRAASRPASRQPACLCGCWVCLVEVMGDFVCL